MTEKKLIRKFYKVSFKTQGTARTYTPGFKMKISLWPKI